VANIITLARDSLTNLVSRLGTDRDKAASSFYSMPVLSDAELLNAYRGAWLPRKIVDIPAFDSVRAWRDWQAKGSKIEDIEAEEKRLNVRGKVLEARIKARLWGGAAIHIGTGDQNLAQPLDVERVGKGGIRHLTVLTRRQLSAGEIERDPASEWYGKPKDYKLTAGDKAQVDIHPSRLVIFSGSPQPDVELVGGGELVWGDSVLLSVMEAIKQADGTAANIASLIFEAKIDIIRIPNFMASLGNEDYKRKIIERYTLANTSKGINGTLMLDKEEEYESKSASFATLPDVLDRFLQIVSGAADIPATRLLGQAPAGMNATGESDLRNYYDRLSAMQSLEMTPAMYRMDEAIIRSALGSRPADIYFDWAPLWGMSEKEKAEVFKMKADAGRALAGSSAGQIIPVDALSDALVNTFTEDGSLPGLEAAIEEYGSLAEQEPSVEEQAAALALEQARKPVAGNPVADAAPRTLYVRRNVMNAAEIIAWAKGQGVDTTLPADELHVTIAFSRTPIDWMKVGEAWEEELKIAAGGPRLMEQFGEATVLLIPSRSLRWRHEDIKAAGASWDHPEYQPHITISYGFKGNLSKVEPYRGEIVLGPEIFEEVNENWRAGIAEDARGAPVGDATFR
jgi:phage-related protein (TIGR01555 family)